MPPPPAAATQTRRQSAWPRNSARRAQLTRHQKVSGRRHPRARRRCVLRRHPRVGGACGCALLKRAARPRLSAASSGPHHPCPPLGAARLALCAAARLPPMPSLQLARAACTTMPCPRPRPVDPRTPWRPARATTPCAAAALTRVPPGQYRTARWAASMRAMRAMRSSSWMRRSCGGLAGSQPVLLPRKSPSRSRGAACPSTLAASPSFANLSRVAPPTRLWHQVPPGLGRPELVPSPGSWLHSSSGMHSTYTEA